jgi:hypothetical protein
MKSTSNGNTQEEVTQAMVDMLTAVTEYKRNSQKAVKAVFVNGMEPCQFDKVICKKTGEVVLMRSYFYGRHGREHDMAEAVQAVLDSKNLQWRVSAKWADFKQWPSISYYVIVLAPVIQENAHPRMDDMPWSLYER